MNPSKNKILQSLRRAQKKTTALPFPEVDNQQNIYHNTEEHLDILFVKNFQEVGGQFVFCERVDEFIVSLEQLVKQKAWENLYCWEKQIQDICTQYKFESWNGGPDIENADAAITTCEMLVARTGSILLSSRQAAGRTLSIFPPVHIVVATTNQVVYDIGEAVTTMQVADPLPSMINLTTGASRTADIEKTLVMGAHGPKELYLFMIET